MGHGTPNWRRAASNIGYRLVGIGWALGTPYLLWRALDLAWSTPGQPPADLHAATLLAKVAGGWGLLTPLAGAWLAHLAQHDEMVRVFIGVFALTAVGFLALWIL